MKTQKDTKTVDPMDALTGFAETTSKVVQQAASILEEEVAAGILAAKQVELRFVNVKELRGDSDETLMNRFRTDSHEVLDILIDMVALGTKYAAALPKRAISIRPTNKKDKPETAATETNGALPVMEIPDTVIPGGTVSFSFVLENSSQSNVEEFKVVGTDLISSQGQRISSRNINTEPAVIVMKPGTTQTVTISVDVPKTVKPGVYSGLVQATEKDIRAVLVVTVV